MNTAYYPLTSLSGSHAQKNQDPAKKIKGSGKCPSLAGNKLQGFQTETLSVDIHGVTRLWGTAGERS